ncbi:GNAT family acetyltransferase [Acuticoccus sp. M5D2P5]|uniref:GNAT family acetyltransferase n=1 Tax=Acuticoccus kalidii TaxID=2910977 RepID=UPI001F233130|nr:GNAT family acetyltransferase [Acuticoccus kalidii]MCF3936134.1 GNAT family acetyltransferase [Acuticoccus kalidii]
MTETLRPASALRIAPIVSAPGEVADAATIDAVIALWQRCNLTRPWNDPLADLRFALASPMSTVLLGHRGDRLVASVMVGHDGHRGVVYYVAVDPEFGRQGHGRAIMAAAEDWLAERGVPKLNLMIRTENAAVAAFYEALGYQIEERVVMAKRLKAS